MDESKICGWTKVYHPSGLQVTLPLPADPKQAFEITSELAGIGWLVTAPSLEAGEQIEEIAYVVRKSKVNDDETETPIIDAYSERGNFRIVGVYLNTPNDTEAFVATTGLKLDKLPYYEGEGTIERGKSPKTDKYVAKLPRPVKLVWKLNPRYEGPEDKKHAKRIFVRWLDTPATKTEDKAQNVITPGVRGRWDALVTEAKKAGIEMSFEIGPEDTVETLTERAEFIKAEIKRKKQTT